MQVNWGALVHRRFFSICAGCDGNIAFALAQAHDLQICQSGSANWLRKCKLAAKAEVQTGSVQMDDAQLD